MDTLLILRDTIAAHVVKFGDVCQSCAPKAATNCNDVKIAVIICGAVVVMVLIVALSFLVFYGIKNCRSRKEQEAVQAKEKDEKWFSLRKEYQNNLLDYLKTDNQNEEYIEELRKSFKWIDEQKK